MDEHKADDTFDLDIVERALAILDEESRTWMTGRPSLPEPTEGDRDA